MAWTAIKRVVAAAVVIVVVALIFSGSFIGLQCFDVGGRARSIPEHVQRTTAGIQTYARDGSLTYLTVPEWYIVYSAEEYASFIGRNPPSQFPYFSAVRQYWGYYGSTCRATKGVYPFQTGTHLILGGIGASFSIENGLKGAYENTLGRLTERFSRDTPEDAFATRTAQEYGRFMHTVPWYEFPFASKLISLWKETPLWGPHAVRRWERKIILSVEYGLKAGYGALIRLATGAAYSAEDLTIHVWIENASDDVFADTRIRRVRQLGPQSYIVRIPRYEAFTDITKKLAAQGVRFVDIAGNEEILLTAVAPRQQDYGKTGGTVLFSEVILTNPEQKRIAVKVPIKSLTAVLTNLEASGARVEHLYDY